MRQSATRELFAYWTALRGERAAPERADVDPAAIRGVLADTFLLEVDDARAFPLLLAGARVNALFGASLREHSFVQLFAAADRRQIANLCANVCDDALPIVAGVRAAPKGEAMVDLELLLLPLRHRGKTHARILGGLAPARFPAWLGLVPIHSLQMVSMRVIAPAPQTGRGLVAAPMDRAGDAPHGSGRGRRRGHLMVIDGGLNAAGGHK